MEYNEKYGIKKNFSFDEKTIKRIEEIKVKLEEDRGCNVPISTIIKEAIKLFHTKTTQNL